MDILDYILIGFIWVINQEGFWYGIFFAVILNILKKEIAKEVVKQLNEQDK